MQIQLYNSQVAKPVRPVVTESGASIAGGLQAIGEGIAQSALSIGDVLSNVQRKQEYDFAVNEATKEVDAFFEDMRLNPILPKVGDLQDEKTGLAGIETPIDIVKLREEAWKNKQAEIEEKYFSSINHKRASDDVRSWWAQSNEKIRSDLAHESISESLQYHGKLRENMIEEHIRLGELDEAYEDIAFGTDSGFWSRSQAEDMYAFAKEEYAYLGGKRKLFDGYTDDEGQEIPGVNSFDRPIDGLEAGYDIIDSLKVNESIKERLKNDLHTDYSETNRIYTEKREAGRDESWDYFTGLIERGAVNAGNLRQWIKAVDDDPRLDDFAGTKEHIWDRMNRAADPGSGGSEAEKMFNQHAFDLWSNRRLTDEMYQQQLRELNRLGIISDQEYRYWSTAARKNVSEVVTNGIDRIESAGNDLIKGLEGEELAGMTHRVEEALFKYQKAIMDIGEEGSDEDVLQAERNVLKNLYAEVLDQTAFAETEDQFLGGVRLDPFEQSLLAIQGDDDRFLEDFSNIAEARAFAEHHGKERLLASYGHAILSAEPLDGPDVSFECETPEGKKIYRFYVDGKKTVLQRWDPLSGWIKSTLESKSEIADREMQEDIGAEWDKPHPMPGGVSPGADDSYAPSPVETRDYSGIPEDLVSLRLDVARRKAERRDLITPSFEEDFKEAKKLMTLERLERRLERNRPVDVDLIIRWLEDYHYPSGNLEPVAREIMNRAGVR